jgi:hypothetical protein
MPSFVLRTMQKRLPDDVHALLVPLLDVADLRRMRGVSRTFAALYTPAAFAQFVITQAEPRIDGITPRVEQLLSNMRLACFVRRVTVRYNGHYLVCVITMYLCAYTHFDAENSTGHA